MNSKKLFSTSVVMAALGTCALPSIANESIDAEIEALKKQVEKLESKNSSNARRLDSFAKKTSSDKITFNGFMSVGASRTNRAVYSSTGGAESRYASDQSSSASLLTDTWFGFQMNADLYEGAEFVVQIIAVGDENDSDASFDPRVEWMYLKQDLGAGFNVQAGRIRFPVFAESENFYIGNTYPWVRPPVEVYNTLPLTRLDGVSVNGSWPVSDDWILDAKALLWATEEVDDFGFGQNTIDDLRGLVLGLSNDSMSFRVSVMTTSEDYSGTVTIPGAVAPNNGFTFNFADDREYRTFAFKYDDGLHYASLEYVDVEVDNGVLPEDERSFVTYGMHFGDWLPYVGVGFTDVKNGESIAASDPTPVFLSFGGPAFPTGTVGTNLENVLNRHQRTFTVGFKWDFQPTAALKFQVQRVDDFGSVSSGGSTIGNFSHGANLNDVDEVWVYDVAIQAIF